LKKVKDSLHINLIMSILEVSKHIKTHHFLGELQNYLYGH